MQPRTRLSNTRRWRCRYLLTESAEALPALGRPPARLGATVQAWRRRVVSPNGIDAAQLLCGPHSAYDMKRMTTSDLSCLNSSSYCMRSHRDSTPRTLVPSRPPPPLLPLSRPLARSSRDPSCKQPRATTQASSVRRCCTPSLYFSCTPVLVPACTMDSVAHSQPKLRLLRRRTLMDRLAIGRGCAVPNNGRFVAEFFFDASDVRPAATFLWTHAYHARTVQHMGLCGRHRLSIVHRSF